MSGDLYSFFGKGVLRDPVALGGKGALDEDLEKGEVVGSANLGGADVPCHSLEGSDDDGAR
jgi:hypothetical protein